MPDISAEEIERAYVEFVPKLLVYARKRLAIPDHAEDIVHDVICSAWMDREGLTVRTWKGFLFGAVKYRIVNDWKCHAHERDMQLPKYDDAEGVPDALCVNRTPEEEYEASVRRRLLAWAVGGLAPRPRRIVLERLDRGYITGSGSYDGDDMSLGHVSRCAEAMAFTRAKASLRSKLSCLL